jgi:AcrR family transcriptional regulator
MVTPWQSRHQKDKLFLGRTPRTHRRLIEGERMPRRTAEETRELLLKVGLSMLLERGASAGIHHIKLQEVLRRTGLTTGAAYRIWTDQTDFQRDLAVAMMKLRFSAPARAAEGAIASMDEPPTSLDDVIRVAAESHIPLTAPERVPADARAFLIALCLRAGADTWPELREAAQARHAESIEEFTRFYGQLMTRFGYRMRTPYSIVDFAEAMAALGEGFSLRGIEGLEHPHIVVGEDDEGPTGSWTLFGIAVRGLVQEFMVRDDTARENTVRDDAVRDDTVRDDAPPGSAPDGA